MKTTKVLLMVVSMLLAVTTTLYAQCGPGGSCKPKSASACKSTEGKSEAKKCGEKAGCCSKMLKDLGLTDEQKEQVKAICQKNCAKMKEIGKAKGEAFKALNEASSAETVDEAKIRELSKTLADKIAEMTILKAKCKKEIGAVLTDEQKTKLEEKKAEKQKCTKAKESKCKASQGCKSKKGCGSK